jgi:hypothetical protein
MVNTLRPVFNEADLLERLHVWLDLDRERGEDCLSRRRRSPR